MADDATDTPCFCFDSEKTESLCPLPCGHRYHLSCIATWASQGHNDCPQCRRPYYEKPVTVAPRIQPMSLAQALYVIYHVVALLHLLTQRSLDAFPAAVTTEYLMLQTPVDRWAFGWLPSIPSVVHLFLVVPRLSIVTHRCHIFVDTFHTLFHKTQRLLFILRNLINSTLV